MANDILQYEGKVWSTADLLIGAGIKQSDFPKFMMPYFALIMVESRLIREAENLRKDFAKDDIDGFIEEFKDLGLGYNDYVVRENKTLKTICKNDKTFDVDFDAYLKAFDSETKNLLGVDKANEEEKFLDISGISGQLRKKRILFDSVKAWSEIDLVPFNNSEITTLEEHIKRKWADISAETAGEQYTPDDIISLISEIIVAKIENNGKFLTLYDPTCGGGNMLFGVEDNIKAKFNRPTKTFGEDWSDSLYALAKIESRFRVDADIRYGNTLTNISFIEKKFDVIVANPPYGIPWKGYEKDIRNDKTDRFVALPNVGDGQLLFDQHIIYHLNEEGLAIVVNNGSSLFSGEAGSGESAIRKSFFEQDLVEAIIQLPSDEFFNTGINTYLWIFNKKKSPSQKDKVILINGSKLYKPLKKIRGKKRNTMDETDRANIVNALLDYKNNGFSKVLDKWDFYYNRQAIMLTNLDYKGKTFESVLPVKVNKDGEEVLTKAQKLTPIKITQIGEKSSLEFTVFEIADFDKNKYGSLYEYYESYISPNVADLDYKEADLKVYTNKATYWYDKVKDTLIEEINGKQKELGCGKIVLKSSFKKATAKKAACIEITAELTPDYQKDYEIIPYSSNEEINNQRISAFLSKYVTKPYSVLDNVIGIEVNFYTVFHESSRTGDLNLLNTQIDSLRKRIGGLNDELTIIQKEISDAATGGSKNKDKLKYSGYAWLGNVPVSWEIARVKDVFYERKDKSKDGLEDLLSVSEYYGVAKKEDKIEDDVEFLSRAESLEGYKLCKQGDLVINIMLAWKRGLGVSEYAGIVSPSYAVYRLLKPFYPRFFHHLFRTDLYISEFKRKSTGIIDSRLRLYTDRFFSIPIAFPPTYEEQKRVADFIDERIKKIEEITLQIESLKSSLNELQSSTIENIMTGIQSI